MKYLTHLVLFQLSREVKPERGRRDPFGLDAASCWCVALASPSPSPASTSASHAKSPAVTQHQHHLTCADIELEYLTPSGKSRATVPVPVQVSSEAEVVQSAWQSQMPRRPPTAHCRAQSKSKHRSRMNNPHSSPYQTSPSPLSK